MNDGGRVRVATRIVPDPVVSGMVRVALDAAALLEAGGRRVTVVNARYIKPLDPRLEHGVPAP